MAKLRSGERTRPESSDLDKPDEPRDPPSSIRSDDPVPDRGFRFRDPRRDDAMTPYIDDGTAALIDEAATNLILTRAPMLFGDAGPSISVLVSLVRQAQAMVFDAVGDARDQEYTWEQIASRLGTGSSAARHRYGSSSRSRMNQFREHA